MSKKTLQRARIKIPGRTLVRNSMGNPILCAWDDCQSPGYDEHKVIVKEPRKTLHYIFCGERHRQFHINSHHSYGKLTP